MHDYLHALRAKYANSSSISPTDQLLTRLDCLVAPEVVFKWLLVVESVENSLIETLARHHPHQTEKFLQAHPKIAQSFIQGLHGVLYFNGALQEFTSTQKEIIYNHCIEIVARNIRAAIATLRDLSRPRHPEEFTEQIIIETFNNVIGTLTSSANTFDRARVFKRFKEELPDLKKYLESLSGNLENFFISLLHLSSSEEYAEILKKEEVQAFLSEEDDFNLIQVLLCLHQVDLRVVYQYLNRERIHACVKSGEYSLERLLFQLRTDAMRLQFLRDLKIEATKEHIHHCFSTEKARKQVFEEFPHLMPGFLSCLPAQVEGENEKEYLQEWVAQNLENLEIFTTEEIAKAIFLLRQLQEKKISFSFESFIEEKVQALLALLRRRLTVADIENFENCDTPEILEIFLDTLERKEQELHEHGISFAHLPREWARDSHCVRLFEATLPRLTLEETPSEWIISQDHLIAVTLAAPWRIKEFLNAEFLAEFGLFRHDYILLLHEAVQDLFESEHEIMSHQRLMRLLPIIQVIHNRIEEMHPLLPPNAALLLVPTIERLLGLTKGILLEIEQENLAIDTKRASHPWRALIDAYLERCLRKRSVDAFQVASVLASDLWLEILEFIHGLQSLLVFENQKTQFLDSGYIFCLRTCLENLRAIADELSDAEIERIVNASMFIQDLRPDAAAIQSLEYFLDKQAEIYMGFDPRTFGNSAASTSGSAGTHAVIL